MFYRFTENGAWSRYGGKVYRTDDFSTTCHFNEPGIYAVFAEFHVSPFFVIILLIKRSLH